MSLSSGWTVDGLRVVGGREQRYGALTLLLPTLDDHSFLRAYVIDLQLHCPYQASINCVACSTMFETCTWSPIGPVYVFQISEL